MSYLPEIRNGCDVWEQAFRRYFVDPRISWLQTDESTCRLIFSIISVCTFVNHYSNLDLDFSCAAKETC